MIDIHDIGDFLEGVKGDSRREKDTPHADGNLLQSKQSREVGRRVDKEIEILEDTEKREVQDQGEEQQQAATSLVGGRGDFPGDDVIHEGRTGHQDKETPVPPAIKKIARGQQKKILSA